AGGTWLALDPVAPAFAALLNGPRLPMPPDGMRPSRGVLPLAVLAGEPVPAPDRYDGYHLLRGGLDTLELWSWDGSSLVHRLLAPGDHLVVNVGLDTGRDPLVAHFAPLLAAAETPDPRPGLAPAAAWG